jgi:hypothetical protein
MCLRAEAAGRVDLSDGVGKRRFEARGRRDVLDGAAPGADQVVVVPRELLRELESSELVGRDDAVNDTDLLEQDEVSIDAALGQAVTRSQDLGDGERARCVGENIDHRGAFGSEALVETAQPRDDMLAKFGLHAPKCTVGRDGRDRALL